MAAACNRGVSARGVSRLFPLAGLCPMAAGRHRGGGAPVPSSTNPLRRDGEDQCDDRQLRMGDFVVRRHDRFETSSPAPCPRGISWAKTSTRGSSCHGAPQASLQKLRSQEQLEAAADLDQHAPPQVVALATCQTP
jgi:hypothetical protein